MPFLSYARIIEILKRLCPLCKIKAKSKVKAIVRH